MNITTIILVPSLWMTALCWEHWVKHYSDKGYCVVARSWPGMEGDIEQLRRDPSSFASLGLADVVDHYEQLIRELETPPIIIGHDPAISIEIEFPLDFARSAVEPSQIQPGLF